MDEIKRICELTGADYSQAEQAYRQANGDFYLAVGNLRRNRKDEGNMNGSAVKSGFTKFLESSLVFGNKKTFSLPLIFAAAIALFGFEFAFPAFIIAFIAGVTFRLTGPLFSKDMIIGLNPEQSQQSRREQHDRRAYSDSGYQNNSGRAYNGNVYGGVGRTGRSFKAEYQQQEAANYSERYGNGSVSYEMPQEEKVYSRDENGFF